MEHRQLARATHDLKAHSGNNMTTMQLSPFHSQDPFTLTLFVALVLHTILLAISFDFEDAAAGRSEQGLEITLIRHPQPEAKPEKADFLAQVNQEAGGTEEEKALPKTELAPPATEQEPEPSRANPEPQEPAPEPEAAPQVPKAEKPAPKKAEPNPKPTRNTRVTASNLMASRDQEIQRLTAELDIRRENFAKQGRRKHISAATQEYKYAAYLQAWRNKVEQIGTLNFPDEAKRNKLYGNLVLQVSLKSDGTIQQIQLRKSSGHKVLDDAAIRIVRLAAPFAPFPKNIAAEVDILDITRTWQFIGGRSLFKSN
jgi:protein TonB